MKQVDNQQEVIMNKCLGLPLVALLASCAHQQPEPTVSMPVRQVSAVGLSPQPLGFYTQRLAEQLFQTPAGQQPQLRHKIAISSFVPVRQLSLVNAGTEQTDLANQLAESLLTEAVQRGYEVVDIRLRAAVLLQQDHEQAFSRLLHELQQQQQARVLLSGTFIPQEDGWIVNARLIDIQSQQVLAAATDYVPDNVLWSAEKMLKRGNFLYRSDRIGERP
ncbi:hypothetical protein AEST_29140 [Alishewanella aestuarii B11]|uniref:FlgO domain-containing protein n=2 Tax=Alishewanella aestuarii TaxID=453835 RepID=J1Y8L3_9ALTE|nr:hypothetical protein AEST_29140 [Alishewanella aestuarii B11]